MMKTPQAGLHGYVPQSPACCFGASFSSLLEALVVLVVLALLRLISNARATLVVASIKGSATL